MLKDEFAIQLQKFLNQIGLTLRQLEGKILIRSIQHYYLFFSRQGEVRLELPPMFDPSKIVRSNKDIVEQAESLVYKWNGEIREALERELKKVKIGEDEWKRHAAIFGCRHPKHPGRWVKSIGGVNATFP